MRRNHVSFLNNRMRRNHVTFLKHQILSCTVCITSQTKTAVRNAERVLESTKCMKKSNMFNVDSQNGIYRLLQKADLLQN